MAVLRFALAQHDFAVGAVDANAARAIDLAQRARAGGADLVVFPELTVSGYPPDDLLRRPSFIAACDAAVARVAGETSGIDVLLGHPAEARAVAHTADEHAFQRPLLNAVSLLRDGREHTRYAKHALPNYGVFDEKRYFTPGTDPHVVEIAGVRVGLLICEDVWIDAPVDAACAAGAQLLVVPNASPYDTGKQAERLTVLQRQAKRHGVGIAYVNVVGGQDDVIFDGASLLIDADGRVAARAPAFREHLLHASFDAASGRFTAEAWPEVADDAEQVLYDGLVCGIRDYVTKNGFPGVLLGLSGGIDSALTLALAVDALGADRVQAVMLPSRYTSQLSLDGARAQAETLGVNYEIVPIESSFEAMTGALEPAFHGKPADLTEENLQARIRGAMLMALSNKHGRLLLATGNKSEMAVGYSTLYGDMCGAYAPIKDVYKTQVYRLARWRNRAGVTIPEAVIERPPSAELRADQTDQDSLPAYDELDAILERFVEREQSRADIVAAGFDAETVERVATLVLRNEFKRRQSAPGPKITPRAFGRERRYPITSGWK
ncbi:NAD+ synthase [Oleiagrimonas soli]|uniref:Glutamine-dependent NAD(+) synthetase n=1 Tax=Oleiagrimonas soli TaxID=1543381 RepID=A0A099CTX0_9GAMM|nr:NAD+ synthase [Oleiagrimonas soli]KGI77032.1 NAD synthetase [Oleiagrimonas soli]MBB6185451.1 NAD+ synthase (glutamine-hydrolyzing) [Oleiagrimonas soli]